MSNIVLTIGNKTAGYPLQYGSIRVLFNYGTGNLSLDLALTTKSAGTGKFQWKGVPDDGINQSAANYAIAFNRDYKNIGGSNNLYAVASANKVTITSKSGDFVFASVDTSNLATLSYTITNTVLVPDLVLSVSSSSSVGDCSTVQRTATASGGVSPYTLKSGATTIASSWNGSSRTFDLSRGSLHSISVTDSTGKTVSTTANTPRNLKASEFETSLVLYSGYADLSVKNINPVYGTTPVTYSLDDVDYSSSTDFTGLPDGTYTLYIKDVFDCVITKTVVIVSNSIPVEEEASQYNHLFVSNLNSIAFSPKEEFSAFNKKNFDNTLSYSEYVKANNSITQQFIEGDVDSYGIGTQFQSSYPYNKVTIHNCDGSKVDIPSIMIQENIGTYEKVDCMLFPITTGIGVYFDGGNEYEPNTETVIGASDYISALPDWAVSGEVVDISGFGRKEVIGFGYSSDLDRNYFIISGSIGSITNSTAQVKYDIQEYNLFEFYLNMSLVSNKAVITIEGGFSFNEINKTWVSECIEKIEDTNEHLLIRWSSYKNVGEMVFASGIQGVMRIKGKIRAYAKGESEVSETDSGSYPLRQSATLGQRVSIPYATPKIWDKLNAVSGISIVGKLSINGIELVRNSEIEQEEKGDSNISEVTMTFDYGYNYLISRQDEIVLNVSTGVEGAGDGEYDTINVVPFDDKTRLIDSSGKFITVGGSFATLN
ncbi:structural protein [Cellulophaga phage Nekkels_1]|uniref:Structural protein n=1 Tax=Cellulophaga phage Nekkels_1 TaxID=2745692 RepID=A0A8E4XXR0_9CAUD|nr:virion structural protein [Cellulophaga phage Nekkels_1]QQO97053.1 structural protein [Cellulophaga phage Nekkels_1]QQO97146.1 structural protein [Cellulophaga phage Nekkels_2]